MSDELYLNVYSDTMNSFHYYLFHTIENGIRIIRNNDDNLSDEDKIMKKIRGRSRLSVWCLGIGDVQKLFDKF